MEGTIEVRRLADGAGVHEVSPGDPLIALEGSHYGARAAWTAPGGFAFVGPAYDGSGWWLTASGDHTTVPALVSAAIAQFDGELAGLTVPRGVPIEQWDVVTSEKSAWDLMLTQAPPPDRPGEDLVAVIEDLAVVQAFLDRTSPTHSVRADDPEVRAWGGVVDGDSAGSGGLLAIGALVRRPSGAAYLGSIATAEKARGRGLASAVAASLTRRAFASGAPECILAHYHPNETARRIYLRLGYRTTHQCTSAAFSR
ncbi:MAG TPA: GNAT family N-acetyltransferase [Actinocrinis sp.]|nr:GNAT family N-acetyltransferase [Actinocrinis sp.]